MGPVYLILNPGSSSKEYALFKDTKQLLHAYYEQHNDGHELTLETPEKIHTEVVNDEIFETSLEDFLRRSEQHGIPISEITILGIRVVAPGRAFIESKEITADYYQALTDAERRAPLHLSGVLNELEMADKLLPDGRFFAISDSEFHSHLSPAARHYAVSQADAQAADVYRYGYHGVSISSVQRHYLDAMKQKGKNLIICHLGNGASITAIKDGMSTDTSMGYSPLEGLVMGTRSGDIDVTAAAEIARSKDMDLGALVMYLNNEAGLKGLSGISNDIRTLLDQEKQGNKDAALALNAMIYRIQKYIGSYYAILGRLDAVIFTATAGERSAAIRERICSPLSHLGITLNKAKNDAVYETASEISTRNAEVKVFVIPTKEASELYHRTKELADR